MIGAIKEINFPEYATLESANVSLADMGEKTITATIKVDGDVTPKFFDPYWEVEFQGERYVQPLRKPQGSKENTSLNSSIELTFQHKAIYELKRRWWFSYTNFQSGIATPDKWVVKLALSLEDFVIDLEQILRYWYGDIITVKLNPSWECKPDKIAIDFSYSYIWDVLVSLYENYGARWKIVPKGDADHYEIQIGVEEAESDHIWEYGFEGGLLKVERQVQSDDIRNMLWGRGGEQNLPYRYFKDEDKYTEGFEADPDWVPELANIYFTELRGATFRSYVQGWKWRHYPEGTITADGPNKAYAPWAWLKGFNDERFDPVEYVKDNKSVNEYGELPGALENNSEIYPTIQEVDSAEHLNYFSKDIGRIDEVVAVEQIETDDIQEFAEATVIDTTIAGCKGFITLDSHTTLEATIPGGEFTIPQGFVGNLTGNAVLDKEPNEVEFEEQYYFKVQRIKGSGPTPIGSSGLTAGTYKYYVNVKLRNLTHDSLTACVSVEAPTLTYTSQVDSTIWKNKFKVWIKNLWASEKEKGESDLAYAERVWNPILGNHLGEEAMITFTDGDLAASEDYEFKILEIPTFDESKTFGKYKSHWCVTLAKSDADMESLGVYVPSTHRQGKGGDHFILSGIDLPHVYVVWAEETLDNYKKDQLKETADIKPTWVVSLDKLRISQRSKEETSALIDYIKVGMPLRLADKRFIVNEEYGTGAYETLYVQSITYNFQAPSNNDAGLCPEVEIVLSDKYETSASPVATMQGEINALTRQLGSISNVEQIVRAVGDKLYLRKDGIADRSMSATEFYSLVTSGDFRSGMVGGRGWGFFRDANGRAVIEVDKMNVRESLEVNTFVSNQIETRGGMIIESAASITISDIIFTNEGDYQCFFDQKGGSVANLFQVNDIGYCAKFNPDNTTERFYKREIIEVGDNYITLAGDEYVGGYPGIGDVVVQYGNTSDVSRQYVIIRDVINGGYERMLEGLDSIYATGEEYYFVGRQAGVYGNRPRFFIGNDDNYLEYTENKLRIKGQIDVESTIDSLPITDYITGKIDNASALVLSLSNDMAAIACDSDGNITSGMPATTTVSVFRGSVKQSGWVLSVKGTNCGASVNQSTGLVSVMAISSTADIASVLITAKKNGYSDLEATFQLYKVKPGASGESAHIYQLGVSTNTITKDANGELSTSSIEVFRYITTGALRQKTTDNWVYYNFEGPVDNSERLLLVQGSTVSGTISNIPTTATAIVVEMRDQQSNTLDLERIPILVDASGLEVGGVNLLEKTNQGTRNWGFSHSTDGDAVLMKSSTTKGLKIQNRATTTTPGWQVLFFSIIPNKLEKEVMYTLSFKAKGDVAGMTLNAQISHITGANLISPIKSFKINTNTERYEFSFKLTKDPNDGVLRHLLFYIYSSQLWNELEIWDLMLEVGNVVTSWKPAPEDIDYLTEALSGSTVIDGGLVLTSIIKVGTQTDGDTLTQKTMAGLSGIADNTPGAGGGLTIWAGGDNIDKALDEVNGSTTGIRLDGSAYFANNTIRFAQNVMEVGDSVELNQDGLMLKDAEGVQRLKVANVSVGDDVDISTANVELNNGTTNLSVQLQKRSKSVIIKDPNTGTIDQSTEYYYVIVKGDTLTYNFPKQITKGGYISINNITARIDSTNPKDNPSLPISGFAHFLIGHYDGTTKRYLGESASAPFESTGNGVCIAQSGAMYIPAGVISGGDYFVEVQILSVESEGTSGLLYKSAQVEIRGTAYNSFESTNILGCDGFLSIWGRVGLLVNNRKAVLRSGDSIFMVGGGQGISYSIDGGNTWKLLN